MPDTTIAFDAEVALNAAFPVHLQPAAAAPGAAAINTGADAIRLALQASLTNHVLPYVDCAGRGNPADVVRLTAAGVVHNYNRGPTAVNGTPDATDTRVPQADVAANPNWDVAFETGSAPNQWPVGYKPPPAAPPYQASRNPPNTRRYICRLAARYGVPRAACARVAAAGAAHAAHHILQMEETAASKALCNLYSTNLDGIYAGYTAAQRAQMNLNTNSTPCMIGVMIVHFAGGATRDYYAISGTVAPRDAFAVAGAPAGASVGVHNPPGMVNWSGVAPAIPLTPAPAASNDLGQCAAPKMLQRLYQDAIAPGGGAAPAVVLGNILHIEMTEQWWYRTPQNAARNPKHGLTEPSCITCQTQVPELLCTA